MQGFLKFDFMEYFKELYSSPIDLIPIIIDIAIVFFFLINFLKLARNSRVWQILKGIAFLLIITGISSLFNFRILNYLLTTLMTYGVIAVIVIFQPELRRGLEQLGSNKFTRFFGIDKDITTKTKEDIYKIVIAAMELSKTKTGGLIVIERDINIRDIINTGILIDAEISPQLLVNIFVPNTPLHDGAVIISNNRISAAACMLPLASDSDISKELGTRHRAAIGMSKESDSIVVVVSEETGKISIAKDGTLIADIKEDVLKKILIKNIIINKVSKKEVKDVKEIKKNIFAKGEKAKNKLFKKNNMK